MKFSLELSSRKYQTEHRIISLCIFEEHSIEIALIFEAADCVVFEQNVPFDDNSKIMGTTVLATTQKYNLTNVEKRKKKRNVISSRHVQSFLFTYVANLRTTEAVIFAQRVLPSELV